MQGTNQRQPPYTSWTSWPPVTQNLNGGFADFIYPRTYSTAVLATPIKRTVEASQTTAVLPVNGYPPVLPLRKTCYSNSDLAARSGPHAHRKPNCSYTVLIGMALKATKSGTLPVSEIYHYIQQEFPFFKTGGPDGWKNSVRHSLSLGQYFRKVERKDGYQGKKGFHWEVVPEKKPALDKEVERFMNEEGLEKIEMTAARAATFKSAATSMLPIKPATAMQPLQSLPAEPERILPPSMASVTQGTPSTARISYNPLQPSASPAESIGVRTLGPGFSVSDAQISQSSLEHLLSTLNSLDATSLQKFSLGDIQNLMLILNKNPAAKANTQNLESIAIAPICNPHPTSAVIQQVSKEPLPSAAGTEMVSTVMAVPSDLQTLTSTAPTLPTPILEDPLPATPTSEQSIPEVDLEDLQTSTFTAPILPSPFQDPLPMQSPTSEQSILDIDLESISEDFPQPSTPIQPGITDIWSDLPILQPDPEMLEEIGLTNADIVSFADSLLSTTSNLCNNCRTQIQQPASPSGVPLPEVTNNTAGNGLTPSDSNDKIEEELNRQKLDFVRREVDQAIELYRSTHPALPQSAISNDIDGSIDDCYTLDNGSGMGNMRPLVDLGSLAETGSVQKSTIYIDMGHLSSQSAFIDPMHPRANVTLAELNKEPAGSLDPHHSATAQYHTPSLDDVDGTPHSDSFTRAIAPVYCDWNCWNDPDYASRMLQQDLEDFDEILHEVTSAHEQEQREEEKRKRRLCTGKTRSNRHTSNVLTSYHNQCEHTSGKWVTLYPDLSEVVENGENELEKQIISIHPSKVTTMSASRCNSRKVPHKNKGSRKRKLEGCDNITDGTEQRKVFRPSSLDSDESETD